MFIRVITGIKFNVYATVTSLAIAEEIYTSESTTKLTKKKVLPTHNKKRGKETGYKEVYWKKQQENCYQAGYQQEIGW